MESKQRCAVQQGCIVEMWEAGHSVADIFSRVHSAKNQHDHEIPNISYLGYV